MLKGLLSRAFVIAILALTMSAWPVEAASSPIVYYHSGPGSLTLTAGSWWITATGNVDKAGYAATCTLNDATNVLVLDTASWSFRSSGQGGSTASYFLTALYSVSTDTDIDVECDGDNSQEAITAVKRTATGLGSTVGASSDSAASFSGTAWHTIASVSLGKGNWWIVGKTTVANTSPSSTSSVGCRILIKPDKDQTSQSMYYTPQPGDEGEVAVQMAHPFSSAGTANLQCTDPKGRPTSVNHVRLTAYKIGRLTRMPVGGSTSNSGASSALPKLITKYLNASLAVGVSVTSVITLNVPAGSWFISAKVLMKDSISTDVYCELDGPTDSWTIDTYGAPGGGLTGLYMQLVFSTPSATNVILNCGANASGTSVTFSRVSALKIAAP